MTHRSEMSGRYWFPLGTRNVYGCPEVGALVAYEHQVYRVFEIRDLPRDRWTEWHEHQARRGEKHRPRAVGLRPARLAKHPDPVKSRSEDRWLDGVAVGSWSVFPDPEHYPVCACCGEPMPCRSEEGRKVAEMAVAKMGRFETAGVCPACSEPVTRRQKSLTFSENLEVLGGPPVTFHVRGRCHHSAMTYEQRWVAADPQRRRTTLSCSGHLTNHNDGTYDCTQLGECPGPTAQHVSASICACPGCHSRSWTWGRGCYPDPKAQLNCGEAAS